MVHCGLKGRLVYCLDESSMSGHKCHFLACDLTLSIIQSTVPLLSYPNHNYRRSHAVLLSSVRLHLLLCCTSKLNSWTLNLCSVFCMSVWTKNRLNSTPLHKHRNTEEMYPISQPYSNPPSQSLSTVRQHVAESITSTVTHLYRHYYYYRYSALGPVWTETRAQSGDWYVSGMLHPGQILRGSLPLLSPRPPRRERSQRRKVGLVGENCPVIFA